MSNPTYGIALPQVYVESPFDRDELHAFVVRAEGLGFTGVWTQDQLIGAATTFDGVSLLCYVASLTRTIRLGVSVIVLPHRTPVPLAKSLATLDQLSGGRLDVGLGLGNPNPHEAAYGLPAGERLRRFREGLATMKALWADGTANHADGAWPLRDAPMEPKPLGRPHPRLWFGGRHPNALRRAVREAHGWMGAGSSTIPAFVEQCALVREQLDAAGRDPRSFRIAKRMYVAIDENESRAERRLRTWFDRYYANADLANQVCIWGSAEKVADAVASVTQAGAGHVLLNPVFDYPMHLEALAQVLPLGEQNEPK
jgi:alkanesulfonate monooxygenase SsuD/methylene tetrahydromethanopterin reductase-like flavin-dependent oxidoreductase (luciferase family)